MVDWDRVQKLFLLAVDLPAGDQSGLLTALCPDDPENRAEVESLLASDRDISPLITTVVQKEASLLFGATAHEGRRVGAYRILREIGRGGMGAVFLAARDDDEYQKQVAIKVVKPGMDTTEILDRFRYERQILANLDHPNIARLFDGGSTADGLPFFVMEYVEGRPVNTFCQECKLNNRSRCELFLRILEAVSYAHRNLVVHRDLKPGNILVVADGTPKLLDFGVAKLVSGNAGASQSTTTVLRPFTPEYASPEQVRGLSVTTSTDIYSLGAVFYEMLTDQRAQPINSPTPEELHLTVCQSEPPRPSQISPSVDADLDNIVLMAMRKEPERRYHSVDQFAEDIRCHLDGKPVLARQDSVTYRLRKFLLRNRIEIGAATVVIGSLAVGLVVSVGQARRAELALQVAERQRLIAVHEKARAAKEAQYAESARLSEAQQRAVAERQKSIADQQRDIAQHQTVLAEQRVNDMIRLANSALFDVNEAVSQLPGSVDARKTIIETTLSFLQRLQTENGLDDPTRMALSAAYVKIAYIQGSYYSPSLQDFAGAEVSLRKAEEILLPLYKRKSTDPDLMNRYLEIEVGLADIASQEDLQQQAIAIYSRVLPIVRELARMKPCDLNCERKEPALEARIAAAYFSLDDPRGLEHANRQVALTREMQAHPPSDQDLRPEEARALETTAEALIMDGELEAAGQDLQQAIHIREDYLHEHGFGYNVSVRHALLFTYGRYISTLAIPTLPNLEKPAEAREAAEKAVALARESVAEDPQDGTARYDLAVSLANLGMIDPTSPNSMNSSLASLQESADLLYPVVKANPNAATRAIQLAAILQYKGLRLERQNRTSDAIRSYQESLAFLQPFLHSSSFGTFRQSLASEQSLALAYASDGNHAAAIDYAMRAVEQAEGYNIRLPPSDSRAAMLARSYATLAAVQQKEGNLDTARQAAVKALSLWKPIHNKGVLSIYPADIAEAEALLGRQTGVSH